MHAVAPPSKDPLAEPAPWSAVAAEYDRVWFERLPGLAERAIELVAPERGDRVLDVGAGPGTVAVRLAPRVGHVMAIDFADGMLERLRRHIMRSRLSNLEARSMSWDDLAFEDASFDAAVSLFGLSSFGERAEGLAELLRVVVPGGRVVLGTWVGSEHDSLSAAGKLALHEALPESSRPLIAERGATPSLLETELDAAGFEQVKSHLFERRLRFGSVAEYWDDFEAASPEVLLLQQQLGVERYAQAAASARAALEAQLGTGAFELHGRVALTYGERPLSAA